MGNTLKWFLLQFRLNFFKKAEKFKSSSGDEKTDLSLTDNNGHIIEIKCYVSNIQIYHVNFDGHEFFKLQVWPVSTSSTVLTRSNTSACARKVGVCVQGNSVCTSCKDQFSLEARLCQYTSVWEKLKIVRCILACRFGDCKFKLCLDPLARGLPAATV